jgi:hypothetical protein
MDVFEDYFTECTETSLKDNYVIVYEVKSFFFVTQKNILYLWIVIG